MQGQYAYLIPKRFDGLKLNVFIDEFIWYCMECIFIIDVMLFRHILG